MSVRNYADLSSTVVTKYNCKDEVGVVGGEQWLISCISIVTGRLLVFPGKDPVSFHFARQLSAYLLGLNSREGDVNYFLEMAITKYYFQSSTEKIKQKTEKNNHNETKSVVW